MFDMEKQKELDLERVLKQVEVLAGQFDTVHIFVTRYDITTGCTVGVQTGSGNWHARRGQIHDWIVKQDENSRIEANAESDDEDA